MLLPCYFVKSPTRSILPKAMLPSACGLTCMSLSCANSRMLRFTRPTVHLDCSYEAGADMPPYICHWPQLSHVKTNKCCSSSTVLEAAVDSYSATVILWTCMSACTAMVAPTCHEHLAICWPNVSHTQAQMWRAWT